MHTIGRVGSWPQYGAADPLDELYPHPYQMQPLAAVSDSAYDPRKLEAWTALGAAVRVRVTFCSTSRMDGMAPEREFMTVTH